jgi:type IV pilus assembly protein PilB
MAIPQVNKPSHLKPVQTQNKLSLKATIKDQSGAGKARIGEILCKEGHITSSQLQEALNVQKKSKSRLGSILLRLGYIEEETIVNVLSRIHNYPSATSSDFNPNPDVLRLLSYETAKQNMAFPMSKKDRTLEVAMTEPTDTAAVEAIQTEVRMGVKVYVATEKAIIEAYKKFYNISDEEYKSFFAKAEEKEDGDLPITKVMTLVHWCQRLWATWSLKAPWKTRYRMSSLPGMRPL